MAIRVILNFLSQIFEVLTATGDWTSVIEILSDDHPEVTADEWVDAILLCLSTPEARVRETDLYPRLGTKYGRTLGGKFANPPSKGAEEVLIQIQTVLLERTW